MRGEILGYDPNSGTGVLRAEDGRRYRFALAQWREASAPEKGIRVDFETSGEHAIDVYAVEDLKRRRSPGEFFLGCTPGSAPIPKRFWRCC